MQIFQSPEAESWEKLTLKSAEYIKAHTERVNLTDIVSTHEGTEYTQEEWIRSEQQEERMDLLKVKKDDLVQIHLAGVRKDLLKGHI